MTSQSENTDLQSSVCNDYTDNTEQVLDEPKQMSVIGVFFRGLLMGAADAVPGVSGGTIALIVGI